MSEHIENLTRLSRTTTGAYMALERLLSHQRNWHVLPPERVTKLLAAFDGIEQAVDCAVDDLHFAGVLDGDDQ